MTEERTRSVEELLEASDKLAAKSRAVHKKCASETRALIEVSKRSNQLMVIQNDLEKSPDELDPDTN